MLVCTIGVITVNSWYPHLHRHPWVFCGTPHRWNSAGNTYPQRLCCRVQERPRSVLRGLLQPRLPGSYERWHIPESSSGTPASLNFCPAVTISLQDSEYLICC